MHVLVGGPAGARIVLLACEDWDNLKNFEMNSCLGAGAQILWRHKGRQSGAASLYFLFLANTVKAYLRPSFFHLWVIFLVEFFRNTLLRRRLQMHSKIDQPKVFFGPFCQSMLRFADFISLWTEIWENC